MPAANKTHFQDSYASGRLFKTWDEVLKVQFLPIIQDQFERNARLLSIFEKNDKLSIDGRQAIFDVKIAPNQAIGSRILGDYSLTDAKGSQKHKQVTVWHKSHHARIEIPGQVIRAGRSSIGRFVDIVTDEMDGIVKDFSKNLNRQLHRDGSGILGTATSVTAAGGGVDSYITLGASDSSKWLHHIEIGEPLSLITKVNATGVYSVVNDISNEIIYVTAIDKDNRRIYVSVDASATYDGAFFANNTLQVCHYKNVSIEAGSSNLRLTTGELVGLDAMCSDTDPFTGGLQGLPVATNQYWKAYVKNGGGTFEEFILMALLQAASAQGADIQNEYYLMSNYGVKNNIIQTLVANNRRWDTNDITGGYKCVKFESGEGEVNLIVDIDAPKNSLKGFSTSVNMFSAVYTKLFDWLNGRSGEILKSKEINNEDVYTATLIGDFELITKARFWNTNYYNLPETWL